LELLTCRSVAAPVLVAAVLGGIGMLIVVGLSGCSASGQRSGPMFQPPSTLEAFGDWDDLDASVQVAAEQSEMAVVRSAPAANDPGLASARSRRFELLTNLNEPVVLEVSREGAAGDRLGMKAAVGRFGDQGRERGLLERLARRLGDLRGVEFAPVRE
jgi:hypothetical protein